MPTDAASPGGSTNGVTRAMRIFDWLRNREPPARPDKGLSRRDFFARVAGRQPAPETGPATEAPPDASASTPTPERLHTFTVAGFSYHDGPVLVPLLRPGIEFALAHEPGHPTDPDAVRIEWRRDHLGYVPTDLAGEVRARLQRGERLLCRASRVDPTADLARVLAVELLRLPDGAPVPD